MKRLAFVAVILALAGPAGAADYAARPAYPPPPLPPPAPVWDWSGIYIGANAGEGWAEETWGLPGTQFFSPSTILATFSTHPKGALAGGQIGINRQVGPWLFGLPWVFGVEFTGDWAHLTDTRVGPFARFPNDVWTTKFTNLETLTFRFGVPVNNWLFYGKAGGAMGAVSLHAVSGPPGVVGVDFSNGQKVWGPTLGAGIEYALTQNLILGVEYDFIRFTPGSFNGVGTAGTFTTPVNVGANSTFDVQMVLGRISYKFWPPTF
jgi:outer membrane immunogenic protein